MSNFVLSACWPLELSPTQKLVLISLADQANDEGVCWPSIASLIRRTCLSERAVRNALRALEDAQLLRTNARDGTSNWYTLTPAAGAARHHVPQPRHHVPPPPAPPAGLPRHQVPPNHQKNHQGTSSEPKAARGTRLPPNWQPDADLLAFAASRGWGGAELADQLDSFRDYWHAAPGAKGVKLDWPATFRNWIRKARPNDRTPAHRGARRESEAERVERINREHDERELAGGALF